VIAKFNTDPTQDRFSNETVLLEMPQADDAQLEAASQLGIEVPATAVAEEPPAVVKPEDNWRSVTTQVKPGDNLALIFKRHGLPPREVYLVSQSEQFGPRLKSIFPGHEMLLKINDNNQLMSLTYSTGPLDTLEYLRQGDEFVSQQITAEPERVNAYKHGTIDHSLFVASQRAGLSDALTMRLAQIFQWDVDFVLDIRPGDSFYVVFEELYLDKEFIGYGDILAAEFINQGDAYRAIQYKNADGSRMQSPFSAMIGIRFFFAAARGPFHLAPITMPDAPAMAMAGTSIIIPRRIIAFTAATVS